MPPDSVADLVPVRQPPCPLPLTFPFYCLSQPGRHPTATPTRGNSRGQGNRQVCPGLSFLRVQISGPRPNSLWAKLLMSSVKLALWDRSAHCHPEQLHRPVTSPRQSLGLEPRLQGQPRWRRTFQPLYSHPVTRLFKFFLQRNALSPLTD